MALVLRHFKTFCKLFGVWPYEGTLSYKSVEIYYRCILFLTFLVSIPAMFKIYLSLFISIDMVNKLLMTMFYSILVLVNQLSAFLNKQVMVNILRDCSLVGQELSRLGEEADFKSTRVFQTSLIVATCFMHSIKFSLYISAYNISPVDMEFISFTFVFVKIQITVMIAMFTGLAQVLKSQFKCINSHVRFLHGLATTHPSEVLTRLQDLINIHTTLRGIVQELNCAYSLNILMFVGYIVTLSSSVLLGVFKNFESGRLEYAIVIMKVYTVLTYFIIIVVLTETCQAAESEANKIVLLIHRLQQRNTNSILLEEIQMFSFGMIKNYVKFTAGGFLDLDRGLIPKICITVTTYLVISLQIKDVVEFENTTALLNITENSTCPGV